MRAVIVSFIAALLGLVSIELVSLSARADEWQISRPLSRVEGIILVVLVDGKVPCDFIRDRLLTSARFVLNSGGIPFDDEPGTHEGEDRLRWAMLVIEAHSLDVKTGCVWTTETTLYATLSGGELMGLPSDSRSVQLWSRASFGSSMGNGLTAYVSEYVETQIKMLINDVHSARKRYPE